MSDSLTGGARPPKSIMFLDLASRFGWCEGTPGEKPRYGSQRFAPEGADSPAVFAGAIKWIGERMQAFRPKVLVYEAPLDPRHMGKRTNLQTASTLLGLPACIEGTAYLSGVYDIRQARIDDIRMHLLSRRPGRQTAKTEVIDRLHALGYQPQDDNAADAIAGWLFACSIVEPKIKPAGSTPLFGDVRGGGEF